MLFSSIIFICYFLPLVLIGNFVFSFNRKLQNFFLMLASLFFYAWGEPVYVLLMILSIIANFVFALLVEEKENNAKRRKAILIISIICNLGLLFVFKYLGFVLENMNIVLGKKYLPELSLALPIGISFFTFQAMSYVIDVYKGRTKASKNIFNIGLYISFFPQLIAGPIVQYNTVADQIENRKFSVDKFSAGCARFAVGFCKKILLANNFALIADYVFGLSSGNVAVSTAWVGALAYTFQIFFDFSAYSDMAIGLGYIFGFKFLENFNYPYIAKSVTEFWRRWHMSLTAWFHEYVYFPLGGSRVKNKDIFVRNMFIVWLLTGIWHGANWTFIIWGLWNFVFLLGERIFDYETNKIPRVIKHILLMWVVVMGWVFFRADSLSMAISYVGNMYGVAGKGILSGTAFMLVREYWVFWFFGIIFCTPFAKNLEYKLVNSKHKIFNVVASVIYPIALILLCIVSFSYLVRGSYNPFIYFNF